MAEFDVAHAVEDLCVVRLHMLHAQAGLHSAAASLEALAFPAR